MAEALIARRVSEKAAAEAAAHAQAQSIAAERERQEAEAFAANEAADKAAAEAAARAEAEREREQANALAAQAAAEAEAAALAAADAEAESAAARRVWAFAWPVTGEPTAAAIATCGAVGLGLCDASREWIGWAHTRALRGADVLAALARVQSPSELVTLSGELAREDVTQLLETSGRVRAIASRAVGLTS